MRVSKQTVYTMCGYSPVFKSYTRKLQINKGFALNLKERDSLEDLGVDGRSILKLLKMTKEIVDFTDLAQDRKQWWVVVNIAISVWVSERAGNILNVREILGAQNVRRNEPSLLRAYLNVIVV
jgi:hypothetical protein